MSSGGRNPLVEFLSEHPGENNPIKGSTTTLTLSQTVSCESDQACFEIWEIVQNIGENNCDPPSTKTTPPLAQAGFDIRAERNYSKHPPLPPLHPLKQDKKHMWTQ